MRYIQEKLSPVYPEGAKRDQEQPVLCGYLQDESPELAGSVRRTAVIVCPGGGYSFRSDREGEPVAMRFLAAGMQAFVLQYSIAPSQYPAAVLELAAAVALIRERAEEWNIDRERVMICGFSAGGHLCASLGTMWKEPFFEEALSCKRYEWKPNGMILCYPVISMSVCRHEGSAVMLMGDRLSSELSAKLSLQERVTEDTVPAFIWSTSEDETVPVENSLLFAAALRKQRVPFELHIYEKGGHGLALCDSTTANEPCHLVPDNAGWMELALRWIGRRS